MDRPSRLVSSALEILEARIAPAAIITFTEADGDTVKVSTSKGSTDDLTAAVKIVNQRIEVIDFVTDPTFKTKFAGSSLSVTVSALGANGDGCVNVGFINATGFALGAVTVKGDLGKIVAGADATKPGVASLTVNSMGTRGTGSGAPDLVSTITGTLGPLRVSGDIEEASLNILGKLTSATIGGGLIGGSAADSGEIQVVGTAGAIKIGGNIEGGSGDHFGAITLSTTGKNGSFTINGIIYGGDGSFSGTVRGGNVTTFFVGGDVEGGSVASTGNIYAGTFTSITVSGDLNGGNGNDSGKIFVGGPGGSITVNGSVNGGGGTTIGLSVKTPTGSSAPSRSKARSTPGRIRILARSPSAVPARFTLAAA